MKWSSAGKVEVEILDDEERGSAEGRLIIMAGQVVNVICTHKAEVRIHVKKLTQYLEKQAHDKHEQYCSMLFPKVSKLKGTVEIIVMNYNIICQLQINIYASWVCPHQITGPANGKLSGFSLQTAEIIHLYY